MITMMQPANTRQGDDTASCAGTLLDQPLARRLFRQTKMRPVLVIIADVVNHEAFQMAFVEHDHMIKQFATANRSAMPFCQGLLKLVRFGRIPKLFMVSMRSPSK